MFKNLLFFYTIFISDLNIINILKYLDIIYLLLSLTKKVIFLNIISIILNIGTTATALKYHMFWKKNVYRKVTRLSRDIKIFVKYN